MNPTLREHNSAAASATASYLGGWLVWGAAIVLAAAVFMVTALSLGRSESSMALLLADKGAALLRAIEGGLRSGMRSQVEVRLQSLLEETIGSDILFIAVTMPDGTILAHSNPERVGAVLQMQGRAVDEDLLQPLMTFETREQVLYRIMAMESTRAFVVYGEFMPSVKTAPAEQPFIFLGLDVTPFEASRASDRTHMLALAGGLLLLGFVCLIALYYALRARDSRRSQRLAEGQVRLLEEEVRRKEKMAAIGNLAAGVAHEIRNPLSSIKGYATYFGQRFPDGSEDRDAAKVMVREVDRLNRVITDLIGLSRPTDVHPIPQNAALVVEHALTLLRQDAEQHKVRLHLTAPPHLPPALIDADRLGQALLNIFLNALQAMPQGGDLTVDISINHRKTLNIIITDTGVGIRPEDVQRIFDPYFSTKGQGTGLGLATVHKIIEAHKGDVRIRSRHGSPPTGTTVHIVLPLAVPTGGPL